jgi:hypothetical protein
MANQEKCRTAGEKAYAADKLIYGNELYESQYAYNGKLQTCLYSGGYSHDDPNAKQCGDFLKHDCNAMWERWVKNSFTNEKILDIINFSINEKGDWSLPTDKINYYWDQEKVLMTQ